MTEYLSHKLPNGIMYEIYQYLDLISLENARTTIPNFSKERPEEMDMVVGYKSPYYANTFLHQYIESYYQSNNLIMNHIKKPYAKWYINPITYAYAQERFYVLRKSQQNAKNTSYSGSDRYQQLLQQKWNKPALLIVFPHNIYIGYIFIIDLDHKLHVISDVTYNNHHLTHINNFFKDRKIINIYTIRSECYILIYDRELYSYGHQYSSSRNFLLPLPYYQHLIRRPFFSSPYIIIDCQCRVWLNNINCLFALRGIKHFMDQMKTDKMPSTLHRPHYLYEIDEDVYAAILEIDEKRIRYWTSKGKEKILEFTHEIKIKNGFPQYIYEEGLETDRYFDVDVQRVIKK